MKMKWQNFLGGLALSERIGGEGSYRYGVGVMIDNPPGFVWSGGDIVEHTDLNLLGNDSVLQNGYALTVNNSTVELSEVDGSTLLSETSTDGHDYAYGVAILTDTSSGAYEELYYGYDTSFGGRIGKYETHGNSYDHTWWTNTLGATEPNNMTHNGLLGKNQKLFVADGPKIRIYDRLTNSTETPVDFPDRIIAFSVWGNYLVVATEKVIYLWDMNAVSWNYAISLNGKFMCMQNWQSGLYFIEQTAEKNGMSYYLNRILNNYSSYLPVRRIPSIITTDNNEVGIPITAGVNYDIFRQSLDMYATPTGLFISASIYEDYNAVHELIFKYGTREGNIMENTLTISHYSADKGSDDVSLYIGEMSWNEHDIFYIDRDNAIAYKVIVGDKGSNEAYFETTEKMTPQVENGISRGIAKKLYVYPAADSTATAVKVKLDGTEYTLDNSATFTANEPKVFSLNGRKFTNAAVRLEKKIPAVYRLELEFDYKKQV